MAQFLSYLKAAAARLVAGQQRRVRGKDRRPRQRRGALCKTERPFGKIALYRCQGRVMANLNGKYVCMARNTKEALHIIDTMFAQASPGWVAGPKGAL